MAEQKLSKLKYLLRKASEQTAEAKDGKGDRG